MVEGRGAHVVVLNGNYLTGIIWRMGVAELRSIGPVFEREFVFRNELSAEFRLFFDPLA